MSSLLEQGKELTAEIMTEDVPHLREAVNQAVTSKEGRQSALTEIWATIKGIWSKIKESGIISVVVEQVKAVIQKVLGRTNATGESAPLLPTSDGDRGLLTNLPNAPESLMAHAGNLLDNLPDAITDNLPPQLLNALNGSEETKPTDTSAPVAGAVAAAAGIAALVAGVSEKLPEAADPEVGLEAVAAAVAEAVPESEAIVETVTKKVEDVVPEAEAAVETVTDTVIEAVPEPEAVVQAVTEKVEDVLPDTEAVVETVTETVIETVPEPDTVADVVSDTVEDVAPEDFVKAVTETAPEPETIVETIAEVPDAEQVVAAVVDSVPKLDADAVAPVVAEVEKKAEE